MIGQNVNQQQQLNYTAPIPFRVLHDPDLNKNHIKLYGQIAQFETNPNFKRPINFANKWFANILGVSTRWVRKLASLLIKKGYITRTRKGQYSYVWATTEHRPPPANSGRNSQFPQSTNKSLSKETTSSSFFNQYEKSLLLAQKLNDDRRTDEQFLIEAKNHIEHCSDKQFTKPQRVRGLAKILSNLKKEGKVFKSLPPKKSINVKGSCSTVQFFVRSRENVVSQTISDVARGFLMSLKDKLKPKYSPVAPLLK